MSIPGKSIGNYVVEGPLPGGGPNLFLARQRGSTEPAANVVKVIPFAESTDQENNAMVILDAIALQDRVSADWQGVVAPILDRPALVQDVKEVLANREAWLVTSLYDTSLEKYLAILQEKPSPALAIWLITRAAAGGALAFKQVQATGGGRRSHGNLKPSNVLIRGLPISETSEIVVADPAPGSRADIDEAGRRRLESAFERRDLHDLGRMIFQLVAGRNCHQEWDWNKTWETPEGNSARWKKVFGKDSEKWKSLCRELLSAIDSPECPQLASVEHRIAGMKPGKEPVSMQWVWKAAAAIVALGAIFGWWSYQGQGVSIEVRSNIPQADVMLLRLGEAEARVASGTGGIKWKGRAGKFRIEARAQGIYSNLPPVQKTIELAPKAVHLELVDFPSARAQFTSDPVNATIYWRSGPRETVLGRSPLELALPPGRQEFRFVLDGHSSVSIQTNLAAATTNLLSVSLQPRESGKVSVEISSSIPGNGTEFFLGDRRLVRMNDLAANQNYQIKIRPPFPWKEFSTNFFVGVSETNLTFSPPSGTLRIDYLDRAPGDAEVWIVSGSVSNRVGTVSDEMFVWPPGTYDLHVRRTGYISTNFSRVTLTQGRTSAMAVAMRPFMGTLRVSANLEGTTVRTNGVVALADVGRTPKELFLTPGVSHQVEIAFDNDQGRLSPFRFPVTIPGGEVFKTNVTFAFGALVLEPAPASATIQWMTSSDSRQSVTNRVRLHDPGSTVRYQIAAIDFSNAIYTATVVAGKTQRQAMALSPRLYPVDLVVNPPQGRLTDPQGRTYIAGRTNLPYGDYSLSAYFGDLEIVSRSFTINREGVTVQKWDLNYGLVSLDTRQRGMEVLINDVPIQKSTPLINEIVKPGRQKFTFTFNDQSSNVFLDVPGGGRSISNFFATIAFVAESYTNSLGMRFRRVNEFYVAEWEVSRAQFNSILAGPKISGRDAQLPARSRDENDLPLVSPAYAFKFCRELNNRDRDSLENLPGGPWEYALPTKSQWHIFADPARGGTSNTVINKPLQPINRNNAPKNSHGLFDIHGNLAEIVQMESGDFEALGGAFSGAPDGTLDPNKGFRADLGFRLVIQRPQ